MLFLIKVLIKKYHTLVKILSTWSTSIARMFPIWFLEFNEVKIYNKMGLKSNSYSRTYDYNNDYKTWIAVNRSNTSKIIFQQQMFYFKGNDSNSTKCSRSYWNKEGKVELRQLQHPIKIALSGFHIYHIVRTLVLQIFF